MVMNSEKAIDYSYKNSIRKVCHCANLICDTNQLDDIRKTLYCDLLHRIKNNCNTLSKLLAIEEDYIAIRLIQRSIIEDLISCFFYIALDDGNLRYAILKMNNQSERSIKDEWLKAHYKIDVANKKSNGESYITEDKYLESFVEYVQKCKVDMATDETKNISIKNFGGNPSEMKKITEDHKLGKPINWLYAEYRFLSQVEHYSLLNRGFSYYNKKDDTINTHEKVIGFCINYLYDVIKELLNDNN